MCIEVTFSHTTEEKKVYYKLCVQGKTGPLLPLQTNERSHYSIMRQDDYSFRWSVPPIKRVPEEGVREDSCRLDSLYNVEAIGWRAGYGYGLFPDVEEAWRWGRSLLKDWRSGCPPASECYGNEPMLLIVPVGVPAQTSIKFGYTKTGFGALAQVGAAIAREICCYTA